MGARGAQGGCEDAGLRSQLPPGPLQGQEVPWGTARLLRMDSFRGFPAQRPSLAKRQSRGPLCGCNLQAGCRLPWVGNWGLTSNSSTGICARAPTVLGQETPPLQPPHTGILPAPGRGELEVCGACNAAGTGHFGPAAPAVGRAWREGGPRWLWSPLTALLLILAPLALLLEVT